MTLPSFHIPVYNGQGEVITLALVDAVDYDWLARYRWHADKGYAKRGLTKPRARSIMMHRELMGLSLGDPRHVDHINRNPLDNRRANLRVLPAGANRQNVGSCKGSSSKYRGVSWEKRRRKWRASGRFRGETITIGRYDNEEEAGEAAAAWRREHMPFAVD
jgi:hypothetical protein